MKFQSPGGSLVTDTDGRGATLVPVKVVRSREQAVVVDLVLGSATLRFERGAAPKQSRAVMRVALEELRG